MFQFIMTVREKKIHTDSSMEQTYAKKSRFFTIVKKTQPLHHLSFLLVYKVKTAWSSLLNLFPWILATATVSVQACNRTVEYRKQTNFLQ